MRSYLKAPMEADFVNNFNTFEETTFKCTEIPQARQCFFGSCSESSH